MAPMRRACSALVSELEVHAIRTLLEVPSPVQATLIGERYELTDTSVFALQSWRGSKPLPRNVQIHGRAMGVLGECCPRSTDEPRGERSPKAENPIKQSLLLDQRKKAKNH